MKQLLLAACVILASLTASSGCAFADSSASNTGAVFHVKERGLTFDKGVFLDGRQNIVPLDTRFSRDDSMYFAPYLSGWDVVNGMVTMMWSMRVLSPSGKVPYEGGTGSKTVERYPVAMINDVPFMIELGMLRTTDPYYTIEFSITDKVSNKGCDGSFRIQLQ